MFKAPENPWLVPFDGAFRRAAVATAPPADAPGKKACKKLLRARVEELDELQRFLARLDEPEKNWKFSTGDVHERGFWDDCLQAFEEAVRETSRPRAPWYAVPADNKPYMRLCVADIVVQDMQSLRMHYPEVEAREREHFDAMRRQLREDRQ